MALSHVSRSKWRDLPGEIFFERVESLVARPTKNIEGPGEQRTGSTSTFTVVERRCARAKKNSRHATTDGTRPKDCSTSSAIFFTPSMSNSRGPEWLAGDTARHFTRLKKNAKALKFSLTALKKSSDRACGSTGCVERFPGHAIGSMRSLERLVRDAVGSMRSLERLFEDAVSWTTLPVKCATLRDGVGGRTQIGIGRL
jgi:hypothetical protein